MITTSTVTTSKAAVPSTRKSEKTKPDAESLLMLPIFRRLLEADFAERDPVNYLKRYAAHIKYAGQLFVYLGLAHIVKASPLTWKPTHRFVEIIGKKVGCLSGPRVKKIDRTDQLIIDLLIDTVFGQGYHNQRERLGLEMLHVLGLIQKDRRGHLGPTPLLLQLFVDAYYHG
jgi:hypothetical protein